MTVQPGLASTLIKDCPPVTHGHASHPSARACPEHPLGPWFPSGIVRSAEAGSWGHGRNPSVKWQERLKTREQQIAHSINHQLLVLPSEPSLTFRPHSSDFGVRHGFSQSVHGKPAPPSPELEGSSSEGIGSHPKCTEGPKQ